MNDPTLIADLVRAGVDADLVARVVAEIVSASVRGLSADSADERRAKDRERKRRNRELAWVSKQPAEANDAAKSSTVSADTSADTADKRCDLSSFRSIENGLSSKEGQKEKKKEVVERQARARGTRLSPGQQITDADWQFARDQGLDAARITAAWTEFVDYWIAVPGQRGTKLDWSATWRNRVRTLGTRVNGHAKQSAGRSLADAADDLIARAEEHDRQGNIVDVTPERD